MELQQTATDKQLQAFAKWADNETEEIVFGGSKGGGKSFFGASCIFHDALVYPGTRYFIARESLNDLRKHTVPTIYEVISKWGIQADKYLKFNGQDSKFTCYNKSEVLLIECSALPSDPLFERFGSMQMTRGWLEECGEIAEMAKVNLSLSVGRWLNDTYKLRRKLLMTCNPKKNWLKYNYIDHVKRGTLAKDKAVIFSNVYDNTFRQTGYEKVLEGLSGVARQRLLLGNWDYDSDDDCLINGEKILDLYTNDFVEKGDRYITGDIARFGKDKTVLFVWEGLRIIDIVIIKSGKITDAANRIKLLINKYQVPLSNVIVDEDGVGGGVVDILGCEGFVNNSSPIILNQTDNKGHLKPDNFDNLKSQCYYQLADFINSAKIFIEAGLDSEFEEDGRSVKELLNQELENVRQKEVDGDGKKAIMKKDKIKEILGRSPDYSDAMMMRMYFEVMPAFQIHAG